MRGTSGSRRPKRIYRSRRPPNSATPVSELDELTSELNCGDDERAEAAAAKLAQAGKAALPRLRRLLKSTKPDERWWAVRTLAAMEQPRTDLLAKALGDKSAEVRAAAALALAAHPDDTTIPDLVRALGDEDSLVSTLCVNALVSLGSACVPALLDAFPTANPRGRIQIMRALAALKDTRAISVMLKATEDDSAMLGYWAREGLDALGLTMVYLTPE